MPDGQFYGAIIWYHLMAPFYGMCVPGLRRWFDLSYLRSAVRSRGRSFRTLCFAVYPVSHVNFASVFRKLPFRSFADYS